MAANKVVIVIGAGPAGLTAALEFLRHTEFTPLILEADNCVGGISRTVEYKGNRIDIGGHRFFSKSDVVMKWWQDILPSEEGVGGLRIDPDSNDKVFLIRNRLSRIYYLRKFFSYPVTLSMETIKNLGLKRMFKIGIGYLRVRLFPIKENGCLEDFFINRFGRELYLTFFKDYTEKVWGVPCGEIKAEWGAQRIKGLSVSKAFWHALKAMLPRKDDGIGQKKVETSLIERFLYPKYGPGQLWQEVADKIIKGGGEIHFGKEVVGLRLEGQKVSSVEVKDFQTGEIKQIAGDVFFSTMPIKNLIAGMSGAVPEEVMAVASALPYRDFLTVGLLLSKLKISNQNGGATLRDNWIYIQEPDVKVGRLQIFNNWSPYMVSDPDTVWVGMEYFVSEGDELWSKSPEEMSKFAVEELVKIGIIDIGDVLDSKVIKMKKTYPSYFGAFDRFPIIRDFTDKIENLFLIGRNGMHKYNNQDHSMLTAMAAVENVAKGRADKSNIWEVNTEQEYHEGGAKEKPADWKNKWLLAFLIAVALSISGIVRCVRIRDLYFSGNVRREAVEVVNYLRNNYGLAATDLALTRISRLASGDEFYFNYGYKHPLFVTNIYATRVKVFYKDDKTISTEFYAK